MTSPLADGFEPPTIDQWRAKAAPDADPRRTIEEGLEAQWLYTPEDALAPDPGATPGAAPFVRGSGITGWDIRQEQSQPERRAAHKAIMEDLEGGATSVLLRFDRASRDGCAPASEEFLAARGRDGVAISTLDDLDQVLDGVYLELAPIALDAGALTIPAAGLLVALWERRDHARSDVRGSLRYDPIGTLAAEGTLADAPARALAIGAELASETAAEHPLVRALAVDTRAFAGAGATTADELAIAAASGIEHLRACERAGLAPAEAARQIEFTLSIGPDQFLEIAKLRAARRIWARILEASGVPAAARRSPIYGRTAERMLARVDPWVNMLRGTTAAFAAAVGGADGITVTPFDAVGGPAGPLGRRIARNTQLILQEESALGRVADPAGGSWYVESLTDSLARAAWERLQDLERGGGLLAMLLSGRLAAEIAVAGERRASEVAHRERELTGVNSFPPQGEDEVAHALPDLDALARLDAARLAEHVRPAMLDEGFASPGRHKPSTRGGKGGKRAGWLRTAGELAAAGARIDEIAAALGGERFAAVPLPVIRDAAAFERLRETAERHAAATGRPAAILLACVGPVARHVSAQNWARSFFAAGGIEVSVSDPLDGRAAAEQALSERPSRLAAVCAHRDEPAEVLAETVAGLRAAGAETIYLAPGSAAAATGCGADLAVAEGVDMPAVLSDALARSGVPADGAAR